MECENTIETSRCVPDTYLNLQNACDAQLYSAWKLDVGLPASVSMLIPPSQTVVELVVFRSPWFCLDSPRTPSQAGIDSSSSRPWTSRATSVLSKWHRHPSSVSPSMDASAPRVPGRRCRTQRHTRCSSRLAP